VTISLKTQKILWGKAAGRCAFPDCRRQLVEDISETDDPTLVGENCHIVAENDGGPRSAPNMDKSSRQKYANLILLCNIHHKIIDDNELVWTVNRLRELKLEHEKWVECSLNVDKDKIRDDTLYADYADEWVRLAHIDKWMIWTSWALSSGQPSISVVVDDDLRALRRWLLGRAWPNRYPSLEKAFFNFGRVLNDFQEVLHKHLKLQKSQNQLFTEKFYKIPDWDPARYQKLADEYDFHVDLVSDLVLELTRAANFICDEVRRAIFPGFRIKEGNLIVQRGPDLEMRFTEFVPVYSNIERSSSQIYAGLVQFYEDRGRRDWYIGTGKPA